MNKIIYIDCFFLTEKKITGVGRFALQILLALDKEIGKKQCSDEYKFIGVMPNLDIELPILNHILIKKHFKTTNQHIWCQIVLPLVVRTYFLINLANFAPIFKKNQLCVIHDALVFTHPDSYSKKFRILAQIIYRKIIKNSNHLATVSNFSASELVKFIGYPKREFIILGNSAENFINIIADKGILEKYDLVKNGYLLSVFSQKNSSYKNVNGYLKAIESIEFKFVCTGNINEKYTNKSNIINIGFVTDGELKALYENALGFVFPSAYEGFGIPPIEAMACGCPVLTSDIPVLREVCNDAAKYFDPHNSNHMHEIILNFINNSNVREELINKGYKHIKHFTWSKYAEKLLGIINSN